MLRALMVDVDGVLVCGRPKDGRHWSTSLQADLGLRYEDLRSEFFNPYWEEIVLGRAALTESLLPVLERIAPHLTPHQLIAYWFEQDSRLDRNLIQQLTAIRSAGIPVYLATNQEHTRADFLMRSLDLATHVDGIYYSAQLGAKKPSRQFFDKIVENLSVHASELLLVDDALDNIRAAREAGWRALHWPGEGLLAKALGAY